ncbi:MAG: GtrA family protein [Lachnospiraceae bacterium]|nr:GtrA family protein [Lachnospiraceae bacterium]
MKKFIENHPDLWQFIMFNLLSNISTITRFVLTWIGTALFVNALSMTSPFRFLIFDYTSGGSNGIGGFLTFLVAEVMAQVVNFFVQKNWVFKSSADFGKSAPKYAVLAVLIVVVNLILPGYVTNFCTGTLGLNAGLAATIASVVNTLLAVVVSFPLLKFWIMPADKKD